MSSEGPLKRPELYDPETRTLYIGQVTLVEAEVADESRLESDSKPGNVIQDGEDS